MLLQLKWQDLQRTVPEVGALMEPIERYLREGFLPTLFGWKYFNDGMRDILGRRDKQSVLEIPDPRRSSV